MPEAYNSAQQATIAAGLAAAGLALSAGTIGTLGDSITAAHETSSFTVFANSGAQSNQRTSNSLLLALDAQLGGGFVQAKANAAVGGTGWDETYTTQLRNFMSVSPRPKYCFMVGPGTNNFYSNSGVGPKTSAYCQPLATRVFDALIAMGVTPIVLTVPPRDSVVSSANFPSQTWTLAKLAEHLAFNAWLKATQPTRWPSMILIDLWADMVDPTDTTNYNPKAGTTDDGLHLSPVYVWDFVKRILKPRIASLFPSRKFSLFGESDQDTVNAWTGSDQILDYPTLIGSGGSQSASAPNSITGTVALGNTLTATNGSGGATAVTASMVDAQSVITATVAQALGCPPPAGNAQKLVITATAAGDQVQLSAAPTSTRLVAGDTYFGACYVYLESAQKLRRLELNAQVVWAAGSVSASSGTPHNTTNYIDLSPIVAGGGVLIPLVTPPITIPAGITITSLAWRLFLSFDGPGAATAYVFQPALRKRTPFS
ncbi:lipase [Caulobacter phage Lullwater]|uniref:Uncharacterized protein n=1 Tax=Caulobacter phage Lullwater TaxID=2024607 RepID=A0A291LBB6_9CAUD|nr:lipase [Caulobacter phage Lullwater]ATI16356.1 hypothetical protein Lull_049 [Caulobacter phage Lullwater]